MNVQRCLRRFAFLAETAAATSGRERQVRGLRLTCEINARSTNLEEHCSRALHKGGTYHLNCVTCVMMRLRGSHGLGNIAAWYDLALQLTSAVSLLRLGIVFRIEYAIADIRKRCGARLLDCRGNIAQY